MHQLEVTMSRRNRATLALSVALFVVVATCSDVLLWTLLMHVYIMYV